MWKTKQKTCDVLDRSGDAAPTAAPHLRLLRASPPDDGRDRRTGRDRGADAASCWDKLLEAEAVGADADWVEVNAEVNSVMTCLPGMCLA